MPLPAYELDYQLVYKGSASSINHASYYQNHTGKASSAAYELDYHLVYKGSASSIKHANYYHPHISVDSSRDLSSIRRTAISDLTIR